MSEVKKLGGDIGNFVWETHRFFMSMKLLILERCNISIVLISYIDVLADLGESKDSMAMHDVSAVMALLSPSLFHSQKAFSYFFSSSS